MKASALLLIAALPALGAFIPPGSEITVRTFRTIHAEDADENRVYDASIDRDVMDHDGRVAIPRGANAELVVRRINGNELVLDLRAVRVNDKRYILDTEDVVQQGSHEKDGVGENRRTGKFLGGGAVIGGIIGAIAGGGRGAAIGAASGAAVGAGTEMATRGRTVRVPAETMLTFRLERGVRVTEAGDWDRQYRPRDNPERPDERR
jgi:hypothetical protein